MKLKKLLALALAALMISTMFIFPAQAAEGDENVMVFKTQNGFEGMHKYMFFRLDSITGTFETKADYYFCYDVMNLTSGKGIGGLTLVDQTYDQDNIANQRWETSLRDNPANKDQNGLMPHPGTDLTAVAFQKWYHREIPLNNYANRTIDYLVMAIDGAPAGETTALFKNIKVIDGRGNTVWSMDDVINNPALFNELTKDSDIFSDYTSNDTGRTCLAWPYVANYNDNNPDKFQPWVYYDLANPPELDESGAESDTEPVISDTEPPVVTAPVTDPVTEPATEGEPQTDASTGATEEKKGCGSAVLAPVMLVTILGGAAISLKKRK